MDTNGNGNGNIFSKFGKYSWILTIVAMIMGPFGSYMLFRQEMLVEIAQITLQVNQNRNDINKVEGTLEQMVPKQVHETRWEMQKEVDKLQEKLEDERFQYLLNNTCKR